ncbi:MAG: Gfo/Idh/MocA family oxidoreductase, partial [Bdellovibrionaceae bacterium]|nr:Gfo/Idh/MocA family oxidoreductase [Pseudobdellovibrionaceae bacterium]
HYDLGLLFLEAGIPVNMEKPLAATAEQARRLVELAEKKKTLLAVGHIERFNPAIVALKSEMRSPNFIELIRHTAFRARGADVSVLHDLMIHDIDLLAWLAGDSEIADMKAWGHRLIGSSTDAAEVFVEMKNGLKARLSASRVSSRPQRAIRVVEKDRALFADTGALELEIIQPVDLNAAEPMKTEKKTIEKKDALQAETDAFVEAVRSGRPAVVSGRDGLRALQIVEAIERILGGPR